MKIHPFREAFFLGRRRVTEQALHSNCQALTAFGASGVDHGAAAFGGHAGAEAMGARTTNLGGLVGAFHFALPEFALKKRRVLDRVNPYFVKPFVAGTGGGARC